MNCLFCKCVSDISRSIEHIIPESLGNKQHVLPKGRVCDKCNNYFAVKVEGELLKQKYFENVRHRNRIYNKRGRSVASIGIMGVNPVDVYLDDNGIILNVNNDKTIQNIINGTIKHIIVPMGEAEPESNNLILSRFLAKVSLEALLHKLYGIKGWIDEVTNKSELEPLKRYARYGEGEFWPYHQRRIYHEDTLFIRSDVSYDYQVLHEWDFFWTKEQEFYFVVAIMGMEYAINMGGRLIETYKQWLVENTNKSILDSKGETRIQASK